MNPLMCKSDSKHWRLCIKWSDIKLYANDIDTTESVLKKQLD